MIRNLNAWYDLTRIRNVLFDAKLLMGARD